MTTSAPAASARDRNRAQIGVGGKNLLRQLGAGVHFAHPGRAQFRHARQHVVALDDGDLELHAGFLGEPRQRRGAAGGIHAARVAHHLDALRADVANDAFHGHIDEIGGVARIRRFGAHRRQNGHGEFGQVIEHQVIDLPAAHQLRAGNRTVAPETRGAADAHDLFSHACFGKLLHFFHPRSVALVAERGHALGAFAAHLARKRLRGAIEDGPELHFGAFLQQRLGGGIRARSAAGDAL